ncbi:MAG: efflux RND transporter periplasmic adaptor subunit [Treponema sp.]
MKIFKTSLAGKLPAIFISAVLMAGCSSEKKTAYEYATVTRGSIENSLSAVGTAEAESSIIIQSPVSGIVDEIFVDAGDTVKKGQLLLNVNSTGNPNDKRITPVYSAVDGVIFARSVNVGSSLLGRGSPAATSLFTIVSGTDVLNITAQIAELDISKIKKDLPVAVNFQAMGGKTFFTKVSEILPMATLGDVVSYTVHAKINNGEKLLRPGMTCSLKFIIEKEENVLCVPNAALRFVPENAELLPDGTVQIKSAEKQKSSSSSSSSSVTQALTGKGSNPSGKKGNPYGHPTGEVSFADQSEKAEADKTAGEENKNVKTLWYTDEDGKLCAVQVAAGISDGIKTAVTPLSSDVHLDGLKVILREAE